jgi:hypothetical protein
VKKTIEEQLEKFKQIKDKYTVGQLKSKKIYGYYYGKPITDPNEYTKILKTDLKYYCEQLGIGYWESIGEQH